MSRAGEMQEKRTTQIRITAAAAKALREQAAALGYVIKRGPMKGYGDGAAMLEAIVAGRIELKKLPPSYDPAFGNDRICVCSHRYSRHFDPYEDMAPVGCKYCGCHAFQEREDDGH